MQPTTATGMVAPPMPAPYLPHQQYHMAAPQQPPQGGPQSGAAGEIRSLWIGDLQYWMDENYLQNCFSHTGQVVSVKIIRNKQSGHSEGYGFIEFMSRATAESVLQSFSGQIMPNTEQGYKLNWATTGSGDRRAGGGSEEGADHTIFVGDLAPDVTDYLLQETFKVHYTSVKGAKVVTDRLTGRSKGYGFVRFGDQNEQQRAMTEMNGVCCLTRPIRVGPATNNNYKKNSGSQQYVTNGGYQSTLGNESDNDPNNTTVFVGGLDTSVVNEENLKQAFAPYGEIVYAKIPMGKRCGFVQFSTRASAEEALRVLNGTMLGGQTVRLSWGRSPSNKQTQQDANQWNGNYYGGGYGQGGYGNYGYAPAQQDPNMYSYAAYSGYGNYQQPPQQQQ